MQASRQQASLSPVGTGSAALSPDQAALALLLRIEQQARRASTIEELRQLAANETRNLTRARQIFVIETLAGRTPTVTAVSGVGSVDGSSMLVASVCELVQKLSGERGLAKATDFALPAFSDPASDLEKAYPFREFVWVPLADRDGTVFAGLLHARETVWGEADIVLATRLAETYAHAWRELKNGMSAARWKWRPRRIALFCGLAIVGALALPVPMTALAPAEIVAADPMIVSAPIDGVVDAIEVDPGQAVISGDVLARLSDTALRNKVEVAHREVAVAEARFKQTTILAMSDARGRHELGIAEAELELKRAELNFATDMLGRTTIKATRSGVAAYADRRSLIGRPVATGERIMEVADPTAVELRIDVAVPDAIALVPRGRVKLFLDIDPLNPREAHIVRSDYKARPGDNDVMSFKTFARLNAHDVVPRIGVRGTAQIYGDRTYLGLFLFRRPLAAARQYLGL